jgi:hypothetical protein
MEEYSYPSGEVLWMAADQRENQLQKQLADQEGASECLL